MKKNAASFALGWQRIQMRVMLFQVQAVAGKSAGCALELENQAE
jgi:hypothetical protein